jgi:hypothetical protein
MTSKREKEVKTMNATREMVNEVVAGVQNYLGDEYDVTSTKSDKGNGVVLDGIVVRKGTDSISSVLYINPEIDADGNVSRLTSCLHDTTTPKFDLEWFTDYEQVKKRLIARLSSCPPKGVVKAIAFCDLYMTVAVDVGIGVVQVKQEHLRGWEKRKEEVFYDALFSSRENRPAIEKGLSNVMEELSGMPVPYDLNFIRVLSNNTRTYGASAIMYAENLPREFYMIPSSVHEVMIVPADYDGIDIHGLSDMVRYVNRTEVSPEEVLSDHAYHYIDGKWEIVE